jgi:hypothetical protein
MGLILQMRKWIDIITLNFDISRFNMREEPVTNDNLKAPIVTPHMSIPCSPFYKKLRIVL